MCKLIIIVIKYVVSLNDLWFLWRPFWCDLCLKSSRITRTVRNEYYQHLMTCTQITDRKDIIILSGYKYCCKLWEIKRLSPHYPFIIFLHYKVVRNGLFIILITKVTFEIKILYIITKLAIHMEMKQWVHYMAIKIIYEYSTTYPKVVQEQAQVC